MERVSWTVTALCFLGFLVGQVASADAQAPASLAALGHHGHHGMFFDQGQVRDSRAQSASSTFERIQNEVFTQSCALQSCHGSNAKAGSLVLEAGASYNALVNTAPTNPAANSVGKKRILPGNLDRSFLWNKLVHSS